MSFCRSFIDDDVQSNEQSPVCSAHLLLINQPTVPGSDCSLVCQQIIDSVSVFVSLDE